MERFTVTIKDNETCEVDTFNTNCIIGSLEIGKLEQGIAYIKCNTIKLAATILSAKDTIKRTLKKNPEVLFLCKMVEEMKGGKNDDE